MVLKNITRLASARDFFRVKVIIQRVPYIFLGIKSSLHAIQDCAKPMCQISSRSVPPFMREKVTNIHPSILLSICPSIHTNIRIYNISRIVPGEYKVYPHWQYNIKQVYRDAPFTLDLLLIHIKNKP